MARHLRRAYQPDDYEGVDLMAFGCAVCPSCDGAFACGAELTTQHGTCRKRGGGSWAGGGATADRAQWREDLLGRPGSPGGIVEPRARKKSIPAELVRETVARMRADEWEALYQAASLSAPVWPARASPEEGAASLAAQVGVRMQGGAEVCVHAVQALLGAIPSCRRRVRTQQVDPLGPFFMAAPLHPVLRAMLGAHPEAYVIGYLDDIHISGEPDRSAVFSPVGAFGAFQGVVDANGDPIPGAELLLEGIKVLGIPVGSDAWVASQCVEMASTAGVILPKLERLNDSQV
eukprot:gene7808-biopygen7883